MYVFTFRKIIDFKRHLNDARQWDNVRRAQQESILGTVRNVSYCPQLKENPNYENMKDDSAPSQIVWKTRCAYATI